MNDENKTLLAAYVDGEIDAVGRQSARRLIECEPEARAYVESLEHLNDRLRAAFDPVAREPVPDALHVTLQHGWRPRRHHWLPVTLAAGAALVAVLLVRQERVDGEMQEHLSLMQDQITQLRQQTLENVPSGSSATWAEPVGMARVEVTPVKTYRTADNRFCREFEERVEDAQGVEIRRGIACRSGKANWPVESSLEITKTTIEPF